MKKLNKKTIIYIAVGVVLLIMIFSIFKTLANRDTIELSGILEANHTEVPSLVSGVIEEIFINEGSNVKKGDIILLLDTKQLEIRKQQAESVVKQAEAKLEMITSGASVSEIKRLQARVNQAQANLQNVSSGSRPEEIAQVQAKVDTTQANFDKAKNEYESAKRLFDQDIISKSKFEEAELVYNNAQSALKGANESLKLLKKGATPGQINIARQELAAAKAGLNQILEGAKPAEIKAAQAQVEQAQAEQKLIEQLIDDSSVKSPIKGTISELSADVGELITKGSTVASVLDLDNLWVKVYVPESKLVYLNHGQSAIISPEALSKLKFPGKVTYIDESGAFIPQGAKESKDQQVFEVKITLEKSKYKQIELRPGMTVKVKIDISENKKQLDQVESKE